MRSSKKWALFQFAFLASFAIALLLSPGSTNAQLSAGSVTGIVRDASGSVVADASVMLRNLDTTIEHKTVSNDAGNYVFLNLGPGRYALEASAPGFATKRVAEFVLAVNQTASIDVSLQVGSQSEVVTISAETEQLDVSTADLGTVIATKQVNDLPLNGTQLLSLTPGVAPVSVAQNAMGGRAGGFGAPISVGWAFIFPAVNGQTNRSNFFLTDGLNNFGSFQSTYSVPPIVDAIQEFKVVSHTDSAQFGSVLGGVVNVVTKSGTNEYHGTGWEYVRNTAFDARNTFLQKVTPFRQNQFGASFGGPVWIPKLYNGRNKTFFYFAYQGFRYTQNNDSLLKVPTAAQLAGDESSFPTQIYNPFSTRPDPANPGKFIRDPFPGNQIPSNLIDPRMVAFIQAVLPPAGPILDSSGDNAIDTTPNHQTQNEYNVRIDQNFGQKNSLFFRYSAINSLLNTSGGLPGLVKHGSIPGRNWGASYVHTFNSSLVLQVQYARTTNQDNSATLFTNPPANLDSTVGFSSTFVGGFAAAGGRSLIPSPGISGYASGGENITNVPKATDSHQVSGNLTKIVRNHTLTFGGGFTTNKFESPLSYASLSFAGGQTGNPQSDPKNPQPGDPLSSFLLNVPDGANRRNVHETTRPGGLMSLYIQDSWKATSKLAFNFGLRYDRTFIPPYGTNATIGQQGGIETGDVDFSNGTYIVQKLPPPCTVRGFAPCIPGNGTLPAHVVVDPSGKIAHDTLTNFGPRVGFAYRLGNRTVLRGAAGIVYDNWAAVSQMAQNIEGAWPDIGQLIANNLNQPSTTSATPTTTSQDPFAGGGSGLFPAPTPFNQVQWFYDPHIKNPYSMQWNFGVQRELNSSTTVDVNYVGSGSRRLNVGGYYNTALTPGPGDPQARAPFPYIAPTFYDRSIGNGSYNALQVELNKRYSNGLAYQVAYTYSKSIDEGSSGWFGVEGQSLTDPYNVAGSRGPSGFDLRHTLSVNMLYQIPVGHGRYSTKNGVLDYILGNWQINNIFTARSGVPFNVYWGASDLANTGNVSWAQYDRANLVGDPHSGSCANGGTVGSVNCIFNTSAFAVPAQFTFGNSGRDAFRSPSFWNLDTSIFRQFPFWGEGRRIEFRAEAFNLFNTVILGTPGNDISNLSSFGKANSTANSPRQLQLGAKIIF